MSGENRALQMVLRFKALDDLSKPLKQVSSAVSTTAKRLKSLQEARKRIDAFRKLQSEVTETGAAMDKARHKVRDLQQQLVARANPSKQLRDQYKQATGELKKLNHQQSQRVRSLAEAQSRMQAAGISTKNLVAYEARLGQAIGTANRHMERQKKNLEELAQKEARLKSIKEAHGKSMQHLAVVGAAGYAGMATGRKVLEGMAGLINPGLDFGAAMSKVQTQTRLSKNSKELQMLREQALQLGGSTAFSATEVAEGQSLLAMAGFNPDAIREAMSGMLSLAKATGTELAQTADISSNILYGFGLDPAQMNLVADVLAATTTRTNVNLADLGDSMKYVAPVAKEMRLSLEEASAMAGLLGNVGIKGSQAGTSLRSIVLRLSSQTGKAAKAMEDLNVDPTDGKGNLRSIPKILADIAKASEKLGNADRMAKLKAIFGDEPAAAVAELLNKQKASGINQFVNELSNVNGEADRMAKTMQDNLTGEIEELSGAFETLRINLSAMIDDDLRSLVRWLTETATRIDTWIQQNPELAKGILVMVAAFSALLAVGGMMLVLFVSVMGPLKILRFGFSLLAANGIAGAGALATMGTALKALGSGLLWVGRAFLTNPILLLVTLLAVLAIAVYKNWDELSAIFKSVYEKAVGWGADMIEGFVNGITNGWNLLKTKSAETVEKIKGWFKEKLGIHSPSRVFMVFGQQTMAGYNEGLDESTRQTLSRVSRISRQITAAGAGMVLAGAIQADTRAPLSAAAGMAVAGDTINIHIHASPGQSAQGIAAEVERILSERERRKAVRQGSQLRD